MSGGHYCAVVLVIECGRAKVDQPNIGVLHYSHVLLLQWEGGREKERAERGRGEGGEREGGAREKGGKTY